MNMTSIVTTSLPCFIKATAVYPGEPADNVLLFRGEPGVFDTPGTAYSSRDQAVVQGLCKGPCHLATFNEALSKRLSELPHYDFDVYRSTKIVLDLRDGLWKVESDPRYVKSLSDYHQGELLPVTTLPSAAGHLDSISSETPMGLLVGAHVSAGGLAIVDGQGKKHALDPMVSYSSSPKVGLQFTQGKGRLLVLSVPISAILGKESDCGSNIANDQMIVTDTCPAWTESYDTESEVDAAFFTHPEYVRDSLLSK